MLLQPARARCAGGRAPALAAALQRALSGGADRRVPGHRPAAVRDLRRASTATGRRAAPLFLVGDPKQAIYSFRNADLHTYLRGARARRRAATRWPHNQRSPRGADRGAERAVRPPTRAAFMLDGLDYRAGRLRRQAARRRCVDGSGAARAPLQVWRCRRRPTTGSRCRKRRGAACGRAQRLRRRDRAPAGAPARRGEITHRRAAAGAPATSRCWCAATRQGARMRARAGRAGRGQRRAVAGQRLRQRPTPRSSSACWRRSLEPPRDARCCAPRWPPRRWAATPRRIAALAGDEAALLELVDALRRLPRDSGCSAASASCCASWMRDEGVAARLLAARRRRAPPDQPAAPGRAACTQAADEHRRARRAAALAARRSARDGGRRRGRAAAAGIRPQPGADRHHPQVARAWSTRSSSAPCLCDGHAAAAAATAEGRDYHDDDGAGR
ncbi:MAG: UvrD-helicase domain-containing protein [Comamonadaceae bacterium]|nr:UvrD-helicase domain-containing protein [Comamonadaceae bacterium]